MTKGEIIKCTMEDIIDIVPRKLTNAEIDYIIVHLEWSTKYPDDFFKENELLNPHFGGKSKILRKLNAMKK